MAQTKHLLLLLALWCLYSSGYTQEGVKCEAVTGKPGCVAKCPDGVIDLTSLADEGLEAPRFKELKDRADYLYSFNPCYAFNEGLCENVHICQSSEYNPYLQYSIASYGTEGIYVDNAGKPYIYYKGPSDRQTNVHLHCTNSHTTKVSTDGDQKQFFVYEFDVEGCAVCPGGCSGQAGVAAGGIGIAIIFVTIGGVVAYFIIGMVVMKVKFKKEGLDIVPNRTFWMDFPILVKDGFLFVISPCRKKGEVSYSEMKN